MEMQRKRLDHKDLTGRLTQMANNIFSELFSLSKDLAPWQNEAIRRMFAQGGSLPQKDRDEIFEIALVEHGLKKASTPFSDLMLKAPDLPALPVPGQKLTLVGVRGLTNVNALKSDQRLPIGKQFTVIYGHNASGKSGYARVMKKAFHARAVDQILPNVYVADKAGPASAIFEIEQHGVVRDEKWIDGSSSPSGLSRFAVFDAKCARVYIADSSELSFLPYGFDIIKGLGEITAEIKKRLQNVAAQNTPRPDALSHLVDTTSTGKFVGALSFSVTEDDANKRAEWTSADAETLKAKEKELSELKANSPQTLRATLLGQKKRLEAIKSSVSRLQDGISAARVAEIKEKVTELQKREQAVEVAAKAAFGDLEFNGVGGDVWRELLLAAEKYSTQLAYPGQPFPAMETGAKCVLCFQPLDNAAKVRLKGFWDFIQDDASSKRDLAIQEVESEQGKLGRLPHGVPKEIEVLEDVVQAFGSKVFEEPKVFFPTATSRLTAIEAAAKSRQWSVLPVEPASPAPICEAEIKAIEDRLNGLADDAKVSEQIRLLETEVAELKARLKLNQYLNAVLNHLRSLKFAESARTAADKITTNKIALKAGELQQRLVTDAFKSQVLTNLKEIGLAQTRLGVERQPGGKGKVLHKVTIEGATIGSPDAVFSEGERTAISLACFLAELSANDDNCGIIFDDPVSSFDHRIRAAVVRLLVGEARNRQVVTFTHDLAFLRDLWEEAGCQQIDIVPQNIEALGEAAGIVSENLPWSGKKVNERIQHLETLLIVAKTADASADVQKFRPAVREFYDLLRSTWERAVEELLFNRVVERLERDIKTRSLAGVYVDYESVESVFKGMTRISAVIEAHDHAAGENPSLPTSSDMKNDLDFFKDFVEKQKSKKATAEKQHKHLK